MEKKGVPPRGHRLPSARSVGLVIMGAVVVDVLPQLDTPVRRPRHQPGTIVPNPIDRGGRPSVVVWRVRVGRRSMRWRRRWRWRWR